MKRRDFLKAVGMAAAGAAVGSPVAAASKADKNKPNILFIFADDQTFEGVRALGNPEVKTPNLDRLVARGVTFTHAYNMGSWTGAVCVASRAMLNSGLFLWRARAAMGRRKRPRKGRKGDTPPAAAPRQRPPLWAECMRQAGYRTYFTGKWHVQADAAKVFDVAKDVRGGMPRQTSQGYNRPHEGKGDPWKPWDKKFGGFWEGGKHWSEVVGDHGVAFLQDAARREKPFFMYLAFNAPHDPRQSPKSYVDKYPLDRITVPKNFLPEYPYKDKIGCGRGLRDEKLAPFPRTRYAVKVHRQEYYAIITHMDHEVGRILDALEKSGKASNTYIFFSADHGLAVGHHGLMGKQNLFDHSLRVPLMVCGPGVPQGRKLATPVYLQDIMASALALAGVDRTNHVEFKSLMPLVSGRRERNYDAIYGAYLGVQRCIIRDGHKLLLYPACKKVLLFDLAADPEEMHDLAGNPKHAPTVKKLFAALLALQKQMDDPLDLRKAYPDL